MSRRFVSLRFVLGTTALSAALSAAAFLMLPAEQPASAQDQIRMRIGTVAPSGTPWEKQMRSLRSHIQKQSDGRIRVQMFMGGSLGGEKAMVRRTAAGTLECFGGSTGAISTVARELNIVEAPFLFRDYAQADRALDGPAKEIISDIIQQRGFVFAAWAENGFRSWFTDGDHPIRSPGDLEGLRMRSQEADVHLLTYRAFGAEPVPIDVTNVLTSLQNGVVEGFDNSLLFAFATSWYQSARYLTLSRHSYQPGIVVYSKQWFDGLPADLQAVLTNLPEELSIDGRRQVRRMDPILLKNLGRAGVEVIDISGQRAAFVQEARNVPNQVVSKLRGGQRNRARALLKALRASR